MLSLGFASGGGRYTPAQAAALLRRAGQRIPPYVQQQVEAALRIYVAAAQSEAPLGRHYHPDGSSTEPGTLKRSIQFEVARSGSGTGPLGHAYSDAPQTLWVIEGVAPHPITPHGAWLRFFWPKVGETVLFKKVAHPGQKPNRFHERAFERTEMSMRRTLAHAVRRVAFDIHT
jgi:hypothetical protein